MRQSAGFGDKINPDYAKNVAAAKAEENVLGMLLLYPEYRKQVMDGKILLTGEDFFTEFGHRVFDVITKLENESGFDISLLGEFFTPEEVGRIMRMQLSRSQLSDNSQAVFEESVSSLKREVSMVENDATVDNILNILENKRKNI